MPRKVKCETCNEVINYSDEYGPHFSPPLPCKCNPKRNEVPTHYEPSGKMFPFPKGNRDGWIASDDYWRLQVELTGRIDELESHVTHCTGRNQTLLARIAELEGQVTALKEERKWWRIPVGDGEDIIVVPDPPQTLGEGE